MDTCRMNRNVCRTAPQSGCQNICRSSRCCSGAVPSNPKALSPCACLDQKLPAAMGYVPIQQWSAPFDLRKGLQMGTIFPDLCKPFCGKGGAVCR